MRTLKKSLAWLLALVLMLSVFAPTAVFAEEPAEEPAAVEAAEPVALPEAAAPMADDDPEPDPEPPVFGVEDDFIVLHPGETQSVSVVPGSVPEGASVSFTMDSNTAITLSSAGVIKGVDPGLATVTAELMVDGAAAASAAIKVTVIPDKSDRAPDRIKQAVQLYNFRSVTNANDTRGIDVLREIAAMGYDGVEWYSGNFNLNQGRVYGTPVEEVGALLRELELESAGVHYNSGLLTGASTTSVGTVNETAMTNLIHFCKELGVNNVWAQCSYPMRTGAPVNLSNYTPEQIDALLLIVQQQFELQRQYLEPEGIRIMYHNHAEMYKDSSGNFGLDSMGYDFQQIDYYWLVKGMIVVTGEVNEDASLAYAEERAPYTISLHIKDGSTDISTSRDYTSWGSGSLNLQGIIDVARRHHNIEWVVVENDGANNVPGGPVADARISREYTVNHLNLDRIYDFEVADDFIVLHPGETETVGLMRDPLPEDAELVFTKDDSTAITLSKDGMIKAVEPGLSTVKVEVKVDGETVAETDVKVTVIPDKSDRAPDRIKQAVQLYNFRSVTNARDTRGIDVLRELAAMGYDGVEWYSGNFNLNEGIVYGTPVEEMGEILRELELESAGVHYNSGLLVGASTTNVGTVNETAINNLIHFCHELGINNAWVQCSYPMRTGAPVNLSNYTPEQIDALLLIVQQQFELQRQYLEPEGIRIMYHNHAELYKDSEGNFGLDSMGYDYQQIDYYWLVKGMIVVTGEANEEASLAYAEERAPYTISLHIKDGSTDITTSRDYTSWGSGSLDLQGIIDVARRHHNIEWVVVENDGANNVPGGPVADARISREYTVNHLNLDRIYEFEVADDFIVLHPGETEQIALNRDPLPENAELVFTKDDSTAITLSKDGTIKAVDPGLSTVTLEIKVEGIVVASATIKVTVVPDKSDRAPDRIKQAVQLYNFRSVTNARDTRGIDVLREIAAMGYDGVEWYSGNFNLNEGIVYGTPVEEMGAILRELELESAGVHYNSGLLVGASVSSEGTVNETNMNNLIHFCHELGITNAWVQCSYPMRTGAPVDLTNLTPTEIDAILVIVRQQFDLQRQYLEPEGIRIMYHNHAELYKDSQGNFGLDSMGYDYQQIDYYWLVKGMIVVTGEVNEEASLAYAEERAPHTISLHIKDGSTDVSTSRDYTSWGNGSLDLQGIIDVARRHHNIEWIVVENDGANNVPGGPVADARISREYTVNHLNLERIYEYEVADNFIVLHPGETEQIALTRDPLPEDAELVFVKDDSTAITLSADGVVKGVDPGLSTVTMEIYVKGALSATATIKVTVVPDKSDRDPDRIKQAVQLYNFRSITNARDTRGIDVLREIAAMGYDGVEWYSGNFNLNEGIVYGTPVEEMGAILRELELESAGVHYNSGLLVGASVSTEGTVNETNMNNLIRFCHELGINNAWVQCSYPMRTGAPVDLTNYTPAEIDAILCIVRAQFELQRQYLEPEGIRIMYHNHAELYKDGEGNFGLDSMGYDYQQIDYYWLVKGMIVVTGEVSEDASLAYAEERAPYTISLHIKDGSTDISTSRDYTSWGSGSLNLQGIIDVARRHHNIEWVVVENDGANNVPGGPVADARISREYTVNHLNLERIIDEDTLPAVDVADDFIVLKVGERAALDIACRNVPENAQLRFSSTDGSVAHVLNGANEVIGYRPGVADITVEAYTSSGSWWNPVTTVLASATVKVTVVPEKQENRGLKLGVQMFNFGFSGLNGEAGIELMRELASMGYDGVEWFSGNININNKTVLGIPYEEFRAIMDKLGLESAGLHYTSGLLNGASETSIGTINEAAVLGVVDFCKAFDVKLVWPQTSFPMLTGAPAPLDRYTPTQVESIIGIVNSQYDLYKPYFDEAGVTLMYHNHAEMIQLEDGDFALSKLNFANQIDYYWLVKGLGAIPEIGPENSMEEGLAYIESLSDKIVSLHVKDGTTNINTSSDYVSWGRGEFDIQGVLDIGRSHDNIEWVIVENDGATSVNGGAVQDARISALYAATLDFTRLEQHHHCPCAMFEDMPEYGTPEHEAIDWAFENGITAGISESMFGTGETLTRAQTATFLWAASGKPEIAEADFENPFSDVKAGKWYTKYVLWAAAQGYVNGYEDGTFRPNNELNRGEILTLLYAVAGKPSVEGIENPYSDVAPGKWYEAPALWAYDEGIERGENGVFARNTKVMREVFVLYLYRYMTGNCLAE